MDLELRGREIWSDGRLIATIRDEYSVEEWLWRFDPGQPRPARFDQCDATCTTDCGHCKGAGRP